MQAMINKGYKFKIMPTAEQKTFFLQAFGCARKLYNHYVDTMYTYLKSIGYEKGYIPIKGIPLYSPAAMKKTYSFLQETDSLALCNAQLNFKAAVKKFNKEFDKESYTRSSLKRKRASGIAPTFRDLKGMPSFKTRKDSCFSYTTNNQILKNGDWHSIRLENGMLTLPKVKTHYDNGFGMFRNFLKYKLEEQDKQFIKVKKIKVNKKDACTKTCRP